MTYQTITLEHDGPIARVWLNRPEARNALDARALEELAAVFTDLQRAYDTRVVILGGRGSSFSSGADRKNPPARLSPTSGAGSRERRYTSQVGRRAVEAIERVEAITIARLHGYVVGGGLALALACDFRIAAASTQLFLPEIDLGIPLSWGGVPRLIREVGVARAKEIILMCDRLDAASADRYGLLNRVVPDNRLDATVDDWARRLAAKPAWALHMSKSQFNAYARAAALGDVTEFDGDLISMAAAEDPTRFAFPKTAAQAARPARARPRKRQGGKTRR